MVYVLRCNGYPRPLSSGRGPGHGTGVFGLDIGMDHRPSANSGNHCQGDVAAGLNSNYPSGVVNYEAGKTYTLAWPPKNHVAAACTNPYIPDTALDLFVAPYNGVSDPETFTQDVTFLKNMYFSRRFLSFLRCLHHFLTNGIR